MGYRPENIKISAIFVGGRLFAQQKTVKTMQFYFPFFHFSQNIYADLNLLN